MGQTLSGHRGSACKEPEAGACLACFGNSQELLWLSGKGYVDPIPQGNGHDDEEGRRSQADDEMAGTALAMGGDGPNGRRTQASARMQDQGGAVQPQRQQVSENLAHARLHCGSPKRVRREQHRHVQFTWQRPSSSAKRGMCVRGATAQQGETRMQRATAQRGQDMGKLEAREKTEPRVAQWTNWPVSRNRKVLSTSTGLTARRKTVLAGFVQEKDPTRCPAMVVNCCIWSRMQSAILSSFY